MSPADGNPGFGPWMLVTRKSQRNSREAPRKGKLESDTGKSNKEGLPQSGKGGTTIKDPPQDLPLQKKLNGPLPSSATSHEKKSPNGKKGNSETKRGKEKAGTDASAKGKGVLGPGPSFQKTTNSSGPSSSFNGASSSSIEASFQPTSSPGPEPTGLGSAGFVKATSILPPPPIVRTVTGENGTVLQIIETPQKPNNNGNASNNPSPSVATRTKRNKSKKSASKKSPAKFNHAKPLQIWSPMKEWKPKSKARIASLTLQEINAWTAAAKEVTGNSGEKVVVFTGDTNAPTDCGSNESQTLT
ncbi:unnamed protein product [Linum trigynum]|uniref:Uncharacterized protein n=1 Tax=Linum trigynum TaxID=586398 RepID=A0AAV2E7V7_9ROSI